MSEVPISILKGEFAFPSFRKDAEQLNKIPTEKIGEFIQWTINHEIFSDLLTEGEADMTAKNFSVTSSELLSATRITIYYFNRGVQVSESDILSDFSKLGLDKIKAELIIEALNEAWSLPEAKNYLKRTRKEALPELTAIRWRVDIRYASNDYMPDPEAVAIMKLGTDKSSHIHFEADLNEIIWLENEISRMKKEFLNAQQKLKEFIKQTE
jgi:hypothetical protein